MKKLLTLFAAGVFAMPSFAQLKQMNMVHATPSMNTNRTPALAFPNAYTNTPSPSNRGTALPAKWMNYVDANVDVDNAGSNYTIYPTYQDSTLGTSTAGQKLSTYGFGFSFDPVSPVFYGAGLNSSYRNGFQVTKTTAFSIDSVEVKGFYARRPYNNYTDTLYVEITNTGSVGTYNLYYRNQPANSTDDTFRIATAYYDPIKNKMSDSVTGKVTVKKILNAAAFADSSADGIHTFRLALPTPMAVAAGRKVVSYAHFVSGHTYPNNTRYDSANVWFQATGEPAGAGTEPVQQGKESNIGLVMTSQTRFAPVDSFGFQGHRILVGTAPGYNAAAEFDYPDFGYHVSCATCSGVGISNINNTVKIGDAYPNPANNNVTIPVTMKEVATVNVTFSNTLGQVMASKSLGQLSANQTTNATFSTAGIANGVYFLTVEANGARTTSRFVVAH